MTVKDMEDAIKSIQADIRYLRGDSDEVMATIPPKTGGWTPEENAKFRVVREIEAVIKEKEKTIAGYQEMIRAAQGPDPEFEALKATGRLY
jgi:hypothetical protein